MKYDLIAYETETLVGIVYVLHSLSAAKASALAMASSRTVKDVSPHEFVKAYSAHLKRSGKVWFFIGSFSVWDFGQDFTFGGVLGFSWFSC